MNTFLNRKVLIYVLIFITLFLYVRFELRHENLKSTDWSSYIDETCSPSIRGFAKSFMYSNKDLWLDTSVSMSLWKESMLSEEPEKKCLEDKDQIRQGKCLNFYSHKWSWLNKCQSYVDANLANSIIAN